VRVLLVVALVVGVVLVVVIALLAVGGVVGRLRVEPPRQVFEQDEALEFVAQALPDDLTAEMAYEDVQRIMRLHIDYLHEQGIARSGGDLQQAPGVTVVNPDDVVRYVQWRAGLASHYPSRRQVEEVIAGHLAYFEAIGAVAEVDGPDLEQLEVEQRAIEVQADGDRPDAGGPARPDPEDVG
jgi:hypothetical protein